VTAAPPLPLRFLAVPLVVAVLLAGLYLFAGAIAPGYFTSIGFGAAWMLVAGVTLNQLAKPPKHEPADELLERVGAGQVSAVRRDRDADGNRRRQPHDREGRREHERVLWSAGRISAACRSPADQR